MKFYSVKMRASLNDRHVSGGERITSEESIQKVVSELLARPKEFDFINIKIEKINNIKFIEKSLDIKTVNVKNHKEGNEIALKLLEEAGIDSEIAKAYIDLLHTGANPDRENMRGAMIITKSGKRVEKDRYRGVRTTNVDFLHREEVKKILLEKKYTERTLDALALSTKNLNHPDIIAEYCISDQPDYTTGYVAVNNTYYRINPLKEYSNPKGGRIYFVKDDTDIEELYKYLQEESFLIKEVGSLE